MPGEQLPQRDGERVEIGPAVDDFGPARVAGVDRLEVLGGHVAEAAAEHHLGAERLLGGADVEVGELRRAVGGEQDVRRLDVAVQDAAAMGVIERLREPGPHPADEVSGQVMEAILRPNGPHSGRLGIASGAVFVPSECRRSTDSSRMRPQVRWASGIFFGRGG